MYTDEKVLIGLSGGINSMAVLCWLKERGDIPSELHLFYSHMKEHSCDTFRFVADGIRFARKHFPNVIAKIDRHSVLAYFEKHKMIPHPARSTCSYWLKIKPMEDYCRDKGITIDLVGFVRHELRRINRMEKTKDSYRNLDKQFPIASFDDDWCFTIVKRNIGWYPSIYDIKENDKRVFKHNNCLPCKNMSTADLLAVVKYYPDHMTKADELSRRLQAYWGRNAQDYYTIFGREDYEAVPCQHCTF